MTAQDGIAAGMDATYVPQDVAHARYRAANRTAARANLAALTCDRYGIDPTKPVARGHLRAATAAREFAELCQALGLDEAPPREPGECKDCGEPLPMLAATSQASGKYDHGRCHACTAAARSGGA